MILSSAVAALRSKPFDLVPLKTIESKPLGTFDDQVTFHAMRVLTRRCGVVGPLPVGLLTFFFFHETGAFVSTFQQLNSVVWYILVMFTLSVYSCFSGSSWRICISARRNLL